MPIIPENRGLEGFQRIVLRLKIGIAQRWWHGMRHILLCLKCGGFQNRLYGLDKLVFDIGMFPVKV